MQEDVDLPFDALYEIAMSTPDPISVLNQSKTSKMMVSKFDDNFWKTWIHIHTPEVYMIIDPPNRATYDQVFFTPESLYEKLYNVTLIHLKNDIDILLREEKPKLEIYSEKYTEDQIKFNIRMGPSLGDYINQLNIIKFRLILNQGDIFIVFRSPGDLTIDTRIIGIYKESEIEQIKQKYAEGIREADIGWVKVNMDVFKIGEITKELPKELTIEMSRPG